MSDEYGNPLNLGRLVAGDADLWLPPDKRDKHLYICGATGTGKSKFTEHLVRQDILNWSESQCGLLLLDPHGKLYDDLLAWLAMNDLDRPIILIDLRQDDWVVAYNLLRRRQEADPAVVVANLIEAMAYVWGATGTDETPLFARWATNVLRTLYDLDHTLVEAEYLTDRMERQLRAALGRGARDEAARRDWEFANLLRPQEFEAQIASTVNRLQRFIRNRTIRCTFGQSDVSLNLREALDKGHIILVNLSKERARVSKEDVDVFATLLIADLWTVAQERGKRRGTKPFYVYIDEFQKFLIPTIAENLDEARGFGLHLTLAHQFPNQLLHAGPHGEKVYDSIMENASNKVAFRMTHDKNLDPIARWLFMGVMHPDEIKHELWSTKVMAYREQYRLAYSYSQSDAESAASSDGESFGEGAGRSMSFPVGHPSIDGSMSESFSALVASIHAQSSAQSHAETRGVTIAPVLVPVLGKELSHVQFRSLEEQVFRAMAVLFDQEQRQGVARLVGMRAPASVLVPMLDEPGECTELFDLYTKKLHKRWPFILTATEAHRRLDGRAAYFRSQYLQDAVAASEPTTARHSVNVSAKRADR